MSVVLLLGEGDFSFTVALQHRLTALVALPPQPVTVVATSYDGAADVDAKYPFARSTLDALVKRHPGHLRVCHDVDATKPLLSQLAATLEALPPVCHVVFNFPHLGYEDCRSHASLAAHVFHRVRELFDAQQGSTSLPGAGGWYYLTLAEAQAERWHVLAAAARCGLVCVDDVPFDAAAWQPHYQLRRHHTGRSFQRRIGASRHYCFRRASDAAGPTAGADGNLFRLLAAAADSAPALPPPPAKEEDAAAAAAAPAPAPVQKRRKVDVAVAGAGGYAAAGPGQWACVTCGKVLGSERGARTHVYMVHVLGEGAAASNNGEGDASQLPACGEGGDDVSPAVVTAGGGVSCGECGRVFPHADALRQHAVAKHKGRHTELRPAWSAAAATVSLGDVASAATGAAEEEGGEDGLCVCAVCGWRFPTDAALAAHMVGWQPVAEHLTHACAHCCATFGSERAKKQHENFCSGGDASAAGAADS